MYKKSNVIGGLVTLGVLLAGSQAMALDAYKDRRGVFVGASIGGGVGASELDREGESTGLDDKRQMGLTLRAELGGGVTQNLVFSGQGNWWIRTVQVNQRDLEHQHLNFLANVNLFLIEGLYVTGGFGLAYGSYDSESLLRVNHYSEMGVAAKAGAGAEFFVNGTVAAGVEATYTRHFYSESYFDTIGGGIVIRWY